VECAPAAAAGAAEVKTELRRGENRTGSNISSQVGHLGAGYCALFSTQLAREFVGEALGERGRRAVFSAK
jgi:hypothetical protein